MELAPPNGSDRLDSWKAIAAYLDRDERTVRRWEELGLPIRRVPGGRGRSVFAYASEIDAWLKAGCADRNGDAGAAKRVPAAAATPGRRTALPARWGWAAIVVVVLFATAAWRLRSPALTAQQLDIEMTPTALTAFDTAGGLLWQHRFDPSYMTALPEVMPTPWRVLTGPHAAVFAVTSHRIRRSDELTESGELLSLSVAGQVSRSFSFTDRLSFDGVQYGAPWGITSFAVDDTGGTRRTAVAAHHFQTSPSMVAILDDRFQRRGTYAQWGWIEATHWLAPNRLLIGGFNDARDGGFVALLDPAELDAQAPETPGTHDYCENCGTKAPLRMVVMPRSEVNLAAMARFNRAVVQMMPDRIVARTIEIPSTGQEAVDALYEFTPALDVIRASFSARYWEVHKALENQGKISHSRDACPDKDGPREILVWDPETRWKRVAIRPSRAP